MSPRLRQIGVITREPQPLEDDLTEIFGLTLASRYPGVDEFGLGTAIFPLGNEFFEVVVAAVPGTVADRFIDRRAGQGGFIVMLQCRDLAAYRTRAERLGMRVVTEQEIPGRNRSIQLHPKDTGGTFLELQEMLGPGAGANDGPWAYGGPQWRAARRTHRVTGIAAAQMQSDDPATIAALWAQLLDVPARPLDDGWGVDLHDGLLRFTTVTDGRGDGLSAIDVLAGDLRSVLAAARERQRLCSDGQLEIGGLRIRLVV